MEEKKNPIAQKVALTSKITISYFYTQGKRNLTLLYIHGLGSTKEDSLFMFNNRDLQIYNLLAPDLVGHGESSVSTKFSYKMYEQAVALNKLLDKLKIKNNIILIAHSMGGPIAVSLAELLGKKVIGLIYAEGNLDIGDCTFSKLINESFTFDEWEKKGFNQYLTLFEQDPESWEYAQNFAIAGPKTIYYSAHDLVDVSKTDTLLTRIEQLRIPVTGIFGENNKGKFSSERKLAEKFSISFIPNAGHAMMIDNPQAFTQVINDFLSKISPI